MNRQAEIEKYLLGEMGEVERIDHEDRIFEDDDHFFELYEAENDLVDRYASGDLESAKAKRLEAAAKNDPNLARKVANARTLRDFVISERDSHPIEASQPSGIWDRVAAFFSVSRGPVFAFGSLLLVLGIGLAALYVENGRRNAEIARLESELTEARASGRDAELELELSTSKERETLLQGQIDEERGISGDLASDLARERENRKRLEREIAAIKNSSVPDTSRPGEETVSVLRLDANSSTSSDVPQLNAEGGAQRISLLISLPSKVRPDERVSLRLNGREIARNIAVRGNGPDGRQVNAVISPQQLETGENVITVHDTAGNVLTSYKIKGGQPE